MFVCMLILCICVCIRLLDSGLQFVFQVWACKYQGCLWEITYIPDHLLCWWHPCTCFHALTCSFRDGVYVCTIHTVISMVVSLAKCEERKHMHVYVSKCMHTSIHASTHTYINTGLSPRCVLGQVRWKNANTCVCTYKWRNKEDPPAL